MKSFAFTIAIFLVTALLFSTAAQAQANDEQQIREVILAYGKAMNASDADAVLALYAQDAVFIPAKQPTAIGRSQIKAAYEHEFTMIDLDVRIVFDELVHKGELAFARTRSKGALKILASGKVVPTDAYRAFFVLEKVNGEWKIARFLFNFTR